MRQGLLILCNGVRKCEKLIKNLAGMYVLDAILNVYRIVTHLLNYTTPVMDIQDRNHYHYNYYYYCVNEYYINHNYYVFLEYNALFPRQKQNINESEKKKCLHLQKTYTDHRPGYLHTIAAPPTISSI